MKRFIADFGYFALFLSITVLLVSMLPATIGIAPTTLPEIMRSHYGAGAVIVVAIWFAGFASGSIHARRRLMHAVEELDKENNNGAA